MEIKNTKFQKTEEIRRVRSSKSSSTGEVFTLDLPSSSGPAQTEAATETFALDSLMILQEVNLDDLNKKTAYKQGEKILDILDSIRKDLIMGGLTLDKLHHLAQIIQKKKQTTIDPKLKAIIDEIELRAKVEIAKYEMQSRED